MSVRIGWDTAAHGATLSRVLAIPVVLLLLDLPGHGARFGAAAVFSVAALTDALDGQLARRAPAPSALGATLDLAADKLLVTVVLMDLAARQLAPAWVAGAIVGRELVVAGARLSAGLAGSAVPPRLPGKLKMCLTCLAVPLAMVGAPGADWLLGAAAVLTVASAWPYLAPAGSPLKGGAVPRSHPPGL